MRRAGFQGTALHNTKSYLDWIASAEELRNPIEFANTDNVVSGIGMVNREQLCSLSLPMEKAGREERSR